MKTIREILGLCTNYLLEKGFLNARREAENILEYSLGIKRLDIYMQFDRPLNEDEIGCCRDLLRRRSVGEPLAYIVGEVSFYHCKIKTRPGVFIPRPETEILVDKIVKALKNESLEGKILWDLCSGSGCIGIAIKKALPDLEVCLVEKEDEPFSLSRENAILNGVNVSVLQGDIFQILEGKCAHYVVCNPPYIASNDKNVDATVRDYEPHAALFAGETGLELYERLAKSLPPLLHSNAKVWLELGHEQGERVKEIFSITEWKKTYFEKDWAGHDRFFFLEKK